MSEYWDKVSKVYDKVNDLLPNPLPKCSRLECKKAHRILIKKFGSHKHSPLKGNYPIDSYVRWNKGWSRLIHDLSHYIYNYRKGYTNRFSHSLQHALLELEMTQFAVNEKWFDGSLKPKILSKDEKKELKVKKLTSLFKSWEKKQKLASTYLKKYKSKLKRLNIQQ
jgi:hypothetical protein|tara:strand:+ start:814 stop:1311 length:498 start_codon:yes stop_codon:yes gene_type:complete